MSTAVERLCVVSGLPDKQPTRTSKVKRYRVGISDKGIALLQKSSDVNGDEHTTNNEIFYDTKDNELITNNKWLKGSDASQIFKYKEVKESDSETIDYRLTQCSIADIEELRDKELKVIGKFSVERQILHFKQGFKVHIDQVTFPDGDPHCICSLERIENVPREMYEQLRYHCIAPVRSKICEYLYRYEPELYQILLDHNYVEAIYEMSALNTQWDKVQSNPNLGLIIARAEGRDMNGSNPWDGFEEE